MESVNTKPESVNTESNQFPTPKQEKLTELRGIIANSDAPQSKSRPLKEESNTGLPWYNARIHKTGDLVKMRSVTGKAIEVIVPELDGDGHPVPVF